MEKETAKAIPDKVTKPETIDTSGKTPEKTTTGEYREPAMKALKSYYGEDAEINDDNFGFKMEEMVAKDYLPVKEKNKKYEDANKNIMAFMEDNPEMSGILSDISQGAKFQQVLPKYVDVEALLDSKGGDEALWEENNKTRMANYEKIQARKKMLAENEAKSIETVKEFMAEKKMEGENADEFGKFIAEIIDAANSRNLTVELLEAAYYAKNYKKDVDEAKQMGEISAKNSMIEEKMKSENDLKGDGLPDIESTNEAVESKGSGDDIADNLERIIKKNNKRLF